MARCVGEGVNSAGKNTRRRTSREWIGQLASGSGQAKGVPTGGAAGRGPVPSKSTLGSLYRCAAARASKAVDGRCSMVPARLTGARGEGEGASEGRLVSDLQPYEPTV